jgi:SHS2 domain-containing protein
MTVATWELPSGASEVRIGRWINLYRWLDHTGEMELEIEAPDEAAVFRDAVAALAELMAEEAGGEPVVIELDVTARDRPALLAECLNELLFLAETEEFVPSRLTRVELAGERLLATVEGHRGAVSPLVKGATYHRLRIERSPAGWKAGVVLDV